MDIGRKIKFLREQHCYSQRQLANLLGLSKSSVNMYERNEREPGIDTLRKISSVLHISLDDLLETEFAKREDIN